MTFASSSPTGLQRGIVRLSGKSAGQLKLRHNPPIKASQYPRHRFPLEIISHCVYFRFNLGYRDVEEMMSVRGLTLTYETVRDWCRKFGQTFANGLRRRSPRPGDRWHLDEVFIRINGRIH